jgi:uncharacterized protein (UPF0333 family)
MENIKKLKFYYLCSLFLFLYSNNSFAQTKEANKVAHVASENRKNNVVYTFELSNDYNESSSNQYVGRIKTITNSDVVLELKGNRLNIVIDPNKVKGDDLDNLLRGLVVLNGYSGYSFSKN